MERGIIVSFQGIRVYTKNGSGLKATWPPGLEEFYAGGTSEVRRLRSLYLSINGKSAF